MVLYIINIFFKNKNTYKYLIKLIIKIKNLFFFQNGVLTEQLKD